jgi:D-sedoheptulose 7-phosphate isomerase
MAPQAGELGKGDIMINLSSDNEAKELLTEVVGSFTEILTIAPQVARARQMITNCLKNGGCLFFCGNGGSAADSQHLAAEFLGRFLIERNPLPATALTVDTSALTAIANDYGYEQVFSRQLRGLARKGDILVGISTSGNSINVVKAFEVAREAGVKTIALTGQKDSVMSATCDLAIQVPATSTPRIQEMHIAIGHTICDLVERDMARV